MNSSQIIATQHSKLQTTYDYNIIYKYVIDNNISTINS